MRPVIEIMELPDPESVAMLQAFYSRSPKPIRERLKELECEYLLDVPKANPIMERLKQRLSQYYIGYGHASIGELGEIVLFIENVSIIAAKAIQHHPLYEGQEVSTRYVDFSTQPCLTDLEPFITPFRERYVKWMPEVRKSVAQRYKRYSSDPAFEKTVNARAFDVMRGLLPVGFLTSLAWKTSFRNLRDHLLRLDKHPLGEVRNLASLIRHTVKERYPNAFPAKETRETSDKGWWQTLTPKTNDMRVTRFDMDEVRRGTYYNVHGTLDYGSWRDLARHRPGYLAWAQPYISFFLERGLPKHSYYKRELDAVDVGIFEEVTESLKAFTFHNHMRPDPMTYMAPMFIEVPTVFSWHLHHLMYVLQLRTGKTVHQSLREFMFNVHDRVKALSTSEEISDFDGYGFHKVVFDIDSSEDNWTLKRGTQDIVKKQE